MSLGAGRALSKRHRPCIRIPHIHGGWRTIQVFLTRMSQASDSSSGGVVGSIPIRALPLWAGRSGAGIGRRGQSGCA